MDDERKEEETKTPQGAEHIDADAQKSQNIQDHIPWHPADASILKQFFASQAYVVKTARPGTSLRDLRVQDEDPVYPLTRNDPWKADLTVLCPPDVSVPGPIGEGLGTHTSIEYKSPAQSCTMEALMRSNVYTAAKAYQARDTWQWGFDPAVIILSYHYPRKLFKDIENLDGGKVVPYPEQPGVYTVHTSDRFQAMVIVTKELDYEKDYCKHGYEWYQWMSPDLTREQVLALLERKRDAAEGEKDVADWVTRVALLANLPIAHSLIGDETMDNVLKNEVYHALEPYWPELQSSLQAKLTSAETRLTSAETELTATKSELNATKSKLSEANRLLEAHGLRPVS